MHVYRMAGQELPMEPTPFVKQVSFDPPKQGHVPFPIGPSHRMEVDHDTKVRSDSFAEVACRVHVDPSEVTLIGSLVTRVPADVLGHKTLGLQPVESFSIQRISMLQLGIDRHPPHDQARKENYS